MKFYSAIFDEDDKEDICKHVFPRLNKKKWVTKMARMDVGYCHVASGYCVAKSCPYLLELTLLQQ
jgi:hypothetical protein